MMVRVWPTLDNSGFQAKNAFIKYAGNYYYFDKEGYMLTGRQDIDGKTYLLLAKIGIQLRDSIINRMVNIITLVALVSSTKMVTLYSMYRKKVLQKQKLKFRYFSPTGEMAVGLTHAGGGLQYFDKMASKLRY